MRNDVSTTVRFSVVIPAYNAGATIVASVQSVLAQTYPPYEVIVVNDGSTDQTVSLLEQHFGDRITLIDLPENTGPAHARNVGLAKATGTHIAFQDADDSWHTHKLETIAAILVQHQEVRFIYHPYTLSQVTFDSRTYSPAIRRFSFLQLLFSNPIGTPCVVLQNHPGIRFNESMHYMEDYDLFLREGYRKGIWLLQIPFTQLSRPILSAGGQSSRRWKMRKGEFKAYLNLIRMNPLFLFISPFLILFGLVKHVVKSFGPPRSNY